MNIQRRLQYWLDKLSGQGNRTSVDWGNLRSLTPISRDWGGDRGQPIDRFYIEQFLARSQDDIHGCVLEVGDSAYTQQFGGAAVTVSETLHYAEDNPAYTYIADLTNAPQIPSNRFDCIICIQRVQVIADLQPAIETLYRILAPGGTLLATVPGISPIYRDDQDRWMDHWYFTMNSAYASFVDIFEPANVTVQGYGNRVVAIAFLQGLCVGDLSEEEMQATDEQNQIVFSIHARKPR